MSDELALSESIAPLLVAALLLAAYRFWKDPSVKRAIWLGLAMGITMLGRDELSLLVVFLVVPLVLLARTLSWKRRFATLGIGLLTTAFVVAPWVGYNMSRFQKPTFITTGLGVTLASADCATTYSGSNEGYWSMPCALHYASQPSVNTKADESVEGAELEHLALNYVRHHENRLVPVTLAKVGPFLRLLPPPAADPARLLRRDPSVPLGARRAWGCTTSSSRSRWAAPIVLRRRRIPSFPLWAIGLDVVVLLGVDLRPDAVPDHVRGLAGAPGRGATRMVLVQAAAVGRARCRRRPCGWWRHSVELGLDGDAPAAQGELAGAGAGAGAGST